MNSYLNISKIVIRNQNNLKLLINKSPNVRSLTSTSITQANKKIFPVTCSINGQILEANIKTAKPCLNRIKINEFSTTTISRQFNLIFNKIQNSIIKNINKKIKRFI
jgi:hypothetical protein